MPVTRRNALVLGAAAVGFAGLAGGGRLLWPAPKLAFEDVSRPEGYRRLVGPTGTVSLLGGGFDQTDAQPLIADGRELCEKAFAGLPSGPGKLAIASFSDFFCPYCRVLDGIVRDLTGGDRDVAVVWHEVPLLGFSSQMAARGAVAAGNQGAYDAFQARLIRTSFVPNRRYLADFARGEALDEPRFMADIDSDATDAVLADSLAVFRTFGFLGTPGLAIGRTLINGTVTRAQLRSLIALEKAADAPPGCA